ncbi:MAG: DUF3892 domain-containing protein [Candidatus Poribacteria bacterium]|nr:DUF3892 domain-containing protein [Candidatus Poribacteria bacterium]
MPKRVVDAQADSDGDITAIRLEGNTIFTPLNTAIRMAERGQIENVHVAHTGAGRAYLRTNPNGKEKDNLDYLAGDR